MALVSTSSVSALSADAVVLLEALSEAKLIVSPGGEILYGNGPARRLFGADLAGRPLEDFHAGDPVPLKNFLQRCASTTGHLVGGLLLTASDGSEESYRLRGTRAALSHGAAVLLRVDHQDEERFAELTRKLGALDREVRDRMHAEAVLAETVRERELLLRELQHRVKNNMHMLQSLLAGAERESETDEAKHALRDVSLRVSAIGLVQQLLYSSVDLETIGSRSLANAVLKGALALADRQVDSSCEVEQFEIPINSAVPLALVMNELLTNAVKYGRPDNGRQRIALSMTSDQGRVELKIEDNGPGFSAEQEKKRSSGIGLVKGLMRQLGGSLNIDGEEGTECLVRFSLPSTAAARTSN